MNMQAVVLTGLVFTSTCWAQTAGSGSTPNTQAINAQNANNVCRIYFQKPKPDAISAYEQGRMKHIQFHKSHGDTWTWHTWQIETGDNMGTYVISTCGHAWKDFDDWDKKMGKEDLADAMASMSSSVAQETEAFYVYRADLSLAPPDAPVSPMEAVTIYVLRPGTAEDFMGAVRKVNDALKKEASWPKKSGWLQLANGGEGPTFVLLSDRQGWADYAPLPKTTREVVEATYGKEATDSIFKTLTGSAMRIMTETAVYRPDLSYQGH